VRHAEGRRRFLQLAAIVPDKTAQWTSDQPRGG
jgi:hypothetical protein